MNFFHRQFVVASIFVLVAVASAAPQAQERPIAIINQSSNLEADGSYQFK
jgi:Skp family chaperone for outer membrane proteins